VKAPAQMPRFAASASSCSDSYILTKPVAKAHPCRTSHAFTSEPSGSLHTASTRADN
jgi:hypothetical protein